MESDRTQRNERLRQTTCMTGHFNGLEYSVAAVHKLWYKKMYLNEMKVLIRWVASLLNRFLFLLLIGENPLDQKNKKQRPLAFENYNSVKALV